MNTKQIDQIRARLRSAKWRRDLSECVSLTFFLLTGFLLTLMLLFLLDYVTRFPRALRLAGSCGAFVFWFFCIPLRRCPWHRKKEVETAAGFEKQAMDEGRSFGAMLVSSLEFSEESNQTGSLELRSATIARTVDDVFDPRRLHLIDGRKIRRAVGLFLLVAGGIAGGAFFSPTLFFTFLQRAFGGEIAYPTRTKILSVEVPAFTEWGCSTSVRMTLAGVIPHEAIATLTVEGATPFEQPFQRTKEDPSTFETVVREPKARVSLSIRAGDAVAGPFVLEAVKPPEVAGGMIVAVPSPYTRMSPLTNDLDSCEFPAGSRFSLSVQTVAPTKQCQLLFSNGNVLDAQTEQGGTNFYFSSILLTNSYSCSFRLIDGWGLTNRENRLLFFTARPDRFPLVTVERPLPGALFSRRSRIRYRLTVTDDYGIGQVFCHWVLKRREETEREIRRGEFLLGDGDGGLIWKGEGVLEQRKMDAQPGDWVELSFVAHDQAPAQILRPEKGKMAPPMELHCLTSEELRRRLAEEDGHIRNLLIDITDDMKSRKGLLEQMLQK